MSSDEARASLSGLGRRCNSGLTLGVTSSELVRELHNGSSRPFLLRYREDLVVLFAATFFAAAFFPAVDLRPVFLAVLCEAAVRFTAFFVLFLVAVFFLAIFFVGMILPLCSRRAIYETIVSRFAENLKSNAQVIASVSIFDLDDRWTACANVGGLLKGICQLQQTPIVMVLSDDLHSNRQAAC